MYFLQPLNTPLIINIIRLVVLVIALLYAAAYLYIRKKTKAESENKARYESEKQ